MRGRYALLGGMLIGCCVLAGCTGTSAGPASSSVNAQRVPANGIAPGAPVPGQDKAPAGGGAAASQSSGSGGGGQAAAPVKPLPPSGRQVIRFASITLKVSDVTTAAAGVRQI